MNSCNVLILGCDVYRADHLNYASHIASRLATDPKVPKLYFRKHPVVLGRDQVLTHMQTLAARVQLSEIPQSEPIEEVVDRYSICKIISLSFSTAVVELQLVYRNKLEVAVYAPKLLSKPYYRAVFEELAKKFNLDFHH